MRLWVFVPSPAWGYCGGMIVAIANTFDEAVDVSNQELKVYENSQFTFTPHSFYRSLAEVQGLTGQKYEAPGRGWYDVPTDSDGIEHWHDTSGHNWDKWVLQDVYDLVRDDMPMRALVNYNYA